MNSGRSIDVGWKAWTSGYALTVFRDLVEHFGPWQRDAYTSFDFASPAYHDMVFFHPFMRRAFFDIRSQVSFREEGLLHCYVIRVPPGKSLKFEACDSRGGSASVAITDLRLFMFANGMGILSFGVEAFDLSVTDALWINESMRKIYPSSQQQVCDGRTPCDLMLVLEEGDSRTIVVAETELSQSAECET